MNHSQLDPQEEPKATQNPADNLRYQQQERHRRRREEYQRMRGETGDKFPWQRKSSSEISLLEETRKFLQKGYRQFR